MDKIPTNNPDYQVLQKALAATHDATGLRWKVLAKDQPDFRLNLESKGKKLSYVAEVKRHLRPETLGLVIHQLAQNRERALLVADYVTPPLAERLRQHGVQFIDTAGNAFLSTPSLLIWVKGEKPPDRQKFARKLSRAYGPRGLQVVFALLCKPDLTNRPYRDIGEIAGVAHGTVGWVMPELKEMGFIAHVGEKRRLLMADRLLRQWADAYIRVLRPKLVLGHFEADALDGLQTLKASRYGFTLAGEPAAAKLTRHLRPGTVTLYGSKIEPRFLVDFKLRKNTDGNVEILRRFWNFDSDADVAPIPLIYADLIQTNDSRCLEAAQMLYDDFVSGLKRQG